jgi:ATP-dependent Lon protease
VQRLRAKDLPSEVRAAADKELRRLKRMQPSQPEFTVLRNWIDWVLDLPWTARSALVTSKTPPLKALKAEGKGMGKGVEGQDEQERDEEGEGEKEDAFDVAAVEAQLEKDHYGLGKVKRRILEYIAVRSLTKSLKGASWG